MLNFIHKANEGPTFTVSLTITRRKYIGHCYIHHAWPVPESVVYSKGHHLIVATGGG